MPYLDEVYLGSAVGAVRFRPVKAPTGAKPTRLHDTIARRHDGRERGVCGDRPMLPAKPKRGVESDVIYIPF